MIKQKISQKDKLIILAENNIFQIAKNNPHLQQLKKLIKQQLGQPVKLIKECATSNAIFFTNNNVPAVLFRPIRDNAHIKNEWINKKSLLDFYTIIYNFLKTLSNNKQKKD